ncbi:MAG TPA: hypothetical protein VGT43_02720 [Burkholderiales bacterium]|nr:hypothetical protein [Burkholderiales bacterium]
MKVIRALARTVVLAGLSVAPLPYADGAPSIVHGNVQVTVYDGVEDDLLSARRIRPRPATGSSSRTAY